jgi:hypothetical protein
MKLPQNFTRGQQEQTTTEQNSESSSTGEGQQEQTTTEQNSESSSTDETKN